MTAARRDAALTLPASLARRLSPWLLSLVLVAAASFGGSLVAQRGASISLAGEARAKANLYAEALRLDIQRFRDFPTLLAADPEIAHVVEVLENDLAAQNLNLKLEKLTQSTGARIIYLIGGDGVTRAASNWRTPTSFVGQNYSFRPYFVEALAKGHSEFVALGTVSSEPGFYLARRVDSATGKPGVIVVKMLFDAIEAQWAQAGDIALVTDARGVVVITSEPSFRFRTTRSLSNAEMQAILASRQFGDRPALSALPLDLHVAGETGARQSIARSPVTGTDWSLWSISSAKEPLRDAGFVGALLGASGMAIVVALAGLALVSQNRSRREHEIQSNALHSLEERVSERTRDLHDANQRLEAEALERRRAESDIGLLREELALANRLAILGQITAGVAHEINQPLAAIRSYAHNADRLLERNLTSETRGNLSMISQLTERIGRITDELRSMSRRSLGVRERVEVREAVAGAMLLVEARARRLGVRIETSGVPPGHCVLAEKMRLEQVLINLLQNSLDAVGARPNSRIRLGASQADGMVMIDIEDNGPGVDPVIATVLFTPFQTTKSAGLGLGLVISRDICREFGGDLAFEVPASGGARFRITLPESP